MFKMYKYLRFFNKKGEYLNFEYLEDLDRWVGRIDFGTVSTGIAEDQQLYILEEVFNIDSSQTEYAHPILPLEFGPTGATGFNEIKIKIESTHNNIFIYDFDLSENNNILNRISEYNYPLIVDSNLSIAGSTANNPDIKESDQILSKSIQINLGFIPDDEISYTSVLKLKDSTGHTFGEFLLYGEGEEEDERLRDMLQNLGYDLLPNDSIIFKDSDINESEVDWNLINTKRKELLLEHSRIFPYMGSYLALINVLKFFGYQNLRMKEYWLNVDQQSPYIGTYKQMDIENIFSINANFNNTSLIPSKIYRKTNKFGLFYDITIESGNFDNDGLPIVEEVFQFSPQEILIKIFALKRKLQEYYLPLNTKIVDIVGESVFYAKYNSNFWNDQYRIDDVSLGLHPKFSVYPNNKGTICDLRSLNYFGCPIGTDLSMGGFSNLKSWRIGINSPADVSDNILDNIQTYRLEIKIPFSESIILDTIFKPDLDTGKDFFNEIEIAQKIVNNWKAVQFLNDNFNIFKEGQQSNIIRVVQKTDIGDGEIIVSWFSNTSPGSSNSQFFIPGPTALIGPAGSTANSIDISPGGDFGPSGAPISYYSGCFLGYFDDINLSVNELNDAPDIPVGYPVVLRNDTFDLSMDSANVTFNQLDQIDPLTDNLLYSDFTLSQIITSWNSISDPVYTPVPGFPSTIPTPIYTLNNLGYFGYSEMQWIVYKPETETPEFLFDSGRLPIDQINTIPLILPYVGKYTVELNLWDGFNTKSFRVKTDEIEVSLPESDFIGWYQKLEREYNLNTKKYPVQSDFANQPINDELTLDEYTSTLDLPFHPNEEVGMADITFNSLDTIEFYQTITNPSNNPLIDKFPYRFNLFTDIIKIDDMYHLWFDNAGTRITQWNLKGLTGSDITLFLTESNTIIDLNSNINVIYEEGPTGFEGPTASYAPGSTGDIIVSNSNRRTYRWNGTEWKFIKDLVDSIKIENLNEPTERDNMIKIVEFLNSASLNSNHPFFKNFIYYFNEEYDEDLNLVPYISAVSKNFDKGNRHKIRGINVDVDDKSYETSYFGYLGDIPTFFEIYQVGPTATIQMSNMEDPYQIQSTNLEDLVNELNGPTAQNIEGLNEFEFNLVTGYPGWTGPTGPTGGTYTKVQGVAKDFFNPKEIYIEYQDVIGTIYGRSLIKNPSLDSLRILKYQEELPLGIVVNFNYDNSKICGKKKPKWILKKEDDLNFDDIYYNNQYFSYMFTERGSYTISLELEDTNGNKKTITKREIIKIK